jgi:hypothetical protein
MGMKKKFRWIALMVLMLSAPLQAGTLSNAQIVEMAKAGLPDDIIIAAIAADGKSLDRSPDALLKLKKAGVSDAVIRSVVTSGGDSNSAVATNSAVIPSIGVAAGDLLTEGRLMISDNGVTKDLHLDNFTYGSGLVPWKVVVTFGTSESPVHIDSLEPKFYVGLAPQLDPLQTLFLVKLDKNIINHRRTVGVNPGPSLSKKIIIPWDVAPYFDAGKVAPGTNGYVLTLRAPLKPGEYAIMKELKFYTFGSGSDQKGE